MHGENEMNIKEFSTKELVDELKEREGVNTITAEPYEKKIVNLEGPAIGYTKGRKCRIV